MAWVSSTLHETMLTTDDFSARVALETLTPTYFINLCAILSWVECRVRRQPWEWLNLNCDFFGIGNCVYNANGVLGI